MRNLLLSLILLGCISCSSLAVSLTPSEIKELIVQSAAIAKCAAENPPTGENSKIYLQLNAEMWLALVRFYGLEGD